MVETEINTTDMANKLILLAAAGVLLLSATPASGQGFTIKWSRVVIDGSRTGCVSSSSDNIPESIGSVADGSYHSPGGKIFNGGTVGNVASAVLAAQPVMAPVKKVIGHSSVAMSVSYPESALSNLLVDVIMERVEELSGKKVDVGICNFGGIRIDMPEGDIMLDDIMSMFPFKNNIYYVALKGKDLMSIFERMAESRFEVLGGVEITAKDREILSAEVGGEPVDPEKVYGVATISFLLNGGDNVYVAQNAVEIAGYPEYVFDVMLDYVKSCTAAGRDVGYSVDGRVKIL